MSSECSLTTSTTTTSPLSIHYRTPTELETKKPYPQGSTILGMLTSGATQSATSRLSPDRVIKTTKERSTVTITLGPITTSPVITNYPTATTTHSDSIMERVYSRPFLAGTTETKQSGPATEKGTSGTTESTTFTVSTEKQGCQLTWEQCEGIIAPLRAEIIAVRKNWGADFSRFAYLLPALFRSPIVGHELWKIEMEQYFKLPHVSTDQLSLLMLFAIGTIPHANYVACIEYLASRPDFANCSRWNPGWGNYELHNFMEFEKDTIGGKNLTSSAIAPIAKKYREQQAKLLLQPKTVTLPKGGECHEVTILPEQWSSDLTLETRPDYDKEMWDALWPQICLLKGEIPLQIVIKTTWQVRQDSKKLIARIQAEAKKKKISVQHQSIDTCPVDARRGFE